MDDKLAIEEALIQVAPERRVCLVLHFVEGLRYREIAEIVGANSYVKGVPTKVGGFLDMVTGPDKFDDGSGLANNKETALEILDSLLDLEQLPDERIDGIGTLRYRGKIDWGKLGWGTKEKKGDPQSPSYAELWIDKEDYTIRQAKVDIHVLLEDPRSRKGEQIAISSLVKYFDFNEPTEIRPPLTASGELEPGWSLVESGPPKPKKNTELVDVKPK